MALTPPAGAYDQWASTASDATIISVGRKKRRVTVGGTNHPALARFSLASRRDVGSRRASSYSIVPTQRSIIGIATAAIPRIPRRVLGNLVEGIVLHAFEGKHPVLQEKPTNARH